MPITSTGLLRSARDPADSTAWSRFVEVYSPWLFGWLRRCQLQASDAEDLVQEVLHTVAKELPQFEHNQKTGAFRAWLKAILVNRLRYFLRARQTRAKVHADSELLGRLASQMEDSDSPLSLAWDREHALLVARRMLELTEPEFQPVTWEAFVRTAVKGDDPESVAIDLKLSVDSVYAAKSRVLRRLREKVAEFL